MNPQQEQVFKDWQELDKGYGRHLSISEERNDRLWFERGYNESLVRIAALEQEVERLKLLCEPRPIDRKSTRLNSSHVSESRMPSSA